MGKGLSPLQRAILEVLEAFPSLEATLAGDKIDLSGWAYPRDIMNRMGMEGTASQRAAVSRALARLQARGLVARFHGEVAAVGRSGRYARITDPTNAGAGTRGRQGKNNRPASPARAAVSARAAPGR
jgi:DNA-binding MarR family transcriptional regulator